VNHLYTLLFSLSIILINPIGAMRGEIWTQPKVFTISLICILNFLILWSDRSDLKLTQSWKINRLLWEIFLGVSTAVRSQQYLLVLFASTLIVASTNYYKPFQ
jgi:hypothetical protein